MKPFAYTSAESLAEAIAILSQESGNGTRPLAGGTDLLTLMKPEIATPSHLVDIKRVSDLSDRIDESEDGVTIGTLCKLAEIERSELLRTRYMALAQAAELAATPQLRNMATIGGNLLQRPRCWYFRNDKIDCWLKGGADCPAREGENQLHALFPADPCVAVHPSDPAAALLALDAELTVRGPGGERRIPLGDFFDLPEDDRRTENTLRPDELIVAIHLPGSAESVRSVYLKAMDRNVWAFALVGVALALRVDGSRIASARLVLSGVAPIPWRVPAAEQLLEGADVGGFDVDQVTETALADARPLSRNGYKLPLARALIKRTLTQLTGSPATT
jgi:xanthine dehydrogenase YagS FAD-binding subunit